MPSGRSRMRKKIADRWGPDCVWCGSPAGISGWLTIEHLVPRAQGGTFDLDNLRLACVECNNDRDLWYAIVLNRARARKKRFFSRKQNRYVKKAEFIRFAGLQYPPLWEHYVDSDRAIITEQ